MSFACGALRKSKRKEEGKKFQVLGLPQFPSPAERPERRKERKTGSKQATKFWGEGSKSSTRRIVLGGGVFQGGVFQVFRGREVFSQVRETP